MSLALFLSARLIAADGDMTDATPLQDVSSEAPAAPPSAAASAPGSETPTPESVATQSARNGTIERSDTVGDGTWTIAEPATSSDPTADTVLTYALRVENGIGIEADEAGQEVAGILADTRGWQVTDVVFFQQVTDPEQADFTISIASPPTVDTMCLPAQTMGIWSCRIGEEVALNSDRWAFKTPTYDDLTEYRAYLVNHEVGHFLGHDHARCGGEGLVAPVMLQQSIDLGGCRPNPWPGAEEAD